MLTDSISVSPPVNTPVQLMMTFAEARACVDRIVAGFDGIRRDVLDLKEREGWRALGYPNWRECVAAEFGISQSRVYQLLDAAMVERELSTMVEPPSISERQARELVPVLRSEPDAIPHVWEEVQTRASIDNRPVTAALVREVVSERSEQPSRLAVHFSSDSPEWYTPSHIVTATREALGSIDLDPCSNSHDAPNVPAARHFTVTDNGLAQPWHGRVYMNPPYGREIVEWIEKLAAEYEAGRVDEAVALVPARVDTGWWRRLPATWVCFIAGRLTFSDYESAAPFPSCAAYLGRWPERFVAAFQDIGTIYQRRTAAETGGAE